MMLFFIMMREKWDFLKLNKIRAKQPLTQFTLGKWKLNSYLGPATGLGAYMIKKNLADRLSKEISVITRPIDHELDRVHIHKFRHMGLEPFPSHVDDGGKSTITGVKFGAVKKFKWYRRLPSYRIRARNLIGKLIHLMKSGQLLSQRQKLSDEGQRPRFCFK
jgi:glycosyl transferase, family 25